MSEAGERSEPRPGGRLSERAEAQARSARPARNKDGAMSEALERGELEP
jgi:hypothetical protein